MTTTFHRRHVRLISVVRQVHHLVGKIRTALEEPGLTRKEFLKKHGTMFDMALAELPWAFAQLVVAGVDFQKTMRSGRRGW